jgi:WD40 repeat protein/beta-lactamase regulating signal transducer with metallopeptidase domain
MSSLVSIGLANALCAAVLALFVWLVGRWCRRPAVLHTLWMLVLLKLVTPPLWPVSLAWLPGPTPVAEQPAPSPVPPMIPPTVEPLPSQPVVSETTLKWADEKRQDLVASSRAPAITTTARIEERPPVEVAAVQEKASAAGPAEADALDRLVGCLPMLGVLWLAGTIVWLVYGIWHIGRFQRLLRFARPAPAEVQGQAQKLARQIGLARCPGVYLLPGALPPLVWAALQRARIFFPAGLLDQLDETERASLLLHELAHVRRRDHWVRWLELLVSGLYWWLPLVPWVRQQLLHCEEECCDAWVVGEVPGPVYAGAILRTVDFLAEARLPLPVTASGLAGFPSLKRRLIRIMDGSTPRRLTVLSWLPILAAALLLPFGPSLARSAKDDKTAARDSAATQTEDIGGAVAAEEALTFKPTPNYLVGGNDEVWGLAISRDGRLLAASSGRWDRPGKVTVWDLAANKRVGVYHEGQGVPSVAFSPDGKLLVTGGWGKPALVRNTATGKVVTTLPTRGTVRVAFLPDGKQVVSVSEGKDVRLWDARSGKEVAELKGARTRLQSMAVSSDGKWLAAGGGDPQNGETDPIYLWDLPARKLAATLKEHKGSVLGLAFSPDSKSLASAGNQDRTVIQWDVATGKVRHKMVGHPQSVAAVAYSPDGKVLASAGYDQTAFLWDAGNGEQLAQMQAPGQGLRAVAFSADSKTLLAGGWGLQVRRWDAASHEEQEAVDLQSHKVVPITTMACAPDGRTIALALDEGGVQLLSGQTGEVVHTLKAQDEDDVVTCLAFSPDGKMLAAGSPDKLVRLWEVATGKLRATLDGHKSWIYCVAFSPDGKTLASGGYDRAIKLWDMDKATLRTSLSGHKASVRAVAFSPDGKLLVSGGTDSSIRLWDVVAGKQAHALKGGQGPVLSLAFSPDGKTLASGGEKDTCILWDVAGKTERATLKGHNGEVLAVCFAPAGKLLVTSGQDHSVRLWDVATGESRGILQGHGGAVVSVAFTGPRQLLSAGAGGQVDVWQADAGPARLFKGHKGPVRRLALTPDGRFLLSGGGWPEGDKTARLWDTHSGKLMRTFRIDVEPVSKDMDPGENPNQVYCVAITPDAKRVAVAGVGGDVVFFDAATGKEVRRGRGHAGAVFCLDYSGDGKRLLSGGRDHTMRLWDAETGEQVRLFEGHTSGVECVQFSRDGKRLLSAGRDSTVRLWDTETGKEVRRFSANEGWIQGVAWSPDQRRAVCGVGKDIVLWDLESDGRTRFRDGHTEGVTGVAWAPDGQSILSSSYDYTVCWWDVKTGLRKRMLAQDGFVWNVKFSPDGRRAYSGGGGKGGGGYTPGTDFAIRVWDLASQK